MFKIWLISNKEQTYSYESNDTEKYEKNVMFAISERVLLNRYNLTNRKTSIN